MLDSKVVFGQHHIIKNTVEMPSDTNHLTTEEEDFLARGNVKDSFSEYDEIVALIENLPHAYSQQTNSELSDEKFTLILDKYQEQPHLLDPYLEDLLTRLMKYVRTESSKGLLLHAFRYMYLITKVRGHKVIVRLFPHEVSDLEPIMSMLSQQDPYDKGAWEVKYMLLLWLSMICLIPFDMKRFDSALAEPLMERIIKAGKLYLTLYADNCQEAAALVLAKLLTRPDAQIIHLPDFVSWCIEEIEKGASEGNLNVVVLRGLLLTLVAIFSIGKRSNTISYAPTILKCLESCDIFNNKYSNMRKLAVKLVQRLGTTFLKPILPKWRYQRGSRSLEDTLKTQKSGHEEKNTTLNEDEDEYEVPDEIECIIEHLLTALYDSDTIVRWSAAKGIGRVTGRLPRELADEVVGSVIDCFSQLQSDGAYHGGCLTLAELGRRGLLLPERLDEVVPLLLRSLVYDVKRGAFSVGANVRDSACYLAWSFARAYSSDTIAPYVESIAGSLLIVTAFDREVNCRRAASAAFQENVGRQGQFPHGIDILTKADYFAVGNRSDSYLVIGPYIASFKEYTKSFIDHLCERKVDHWDTEIQWLAAKSLNKFTQLSPLYMSADVLEKLLPMCTGIDLMGRHGSIIAVAEIAHALFAVENQGNMGLLSRNKHLKTIFNIVKTARDAKLFRGYGNDLMRLACCHLIARISQCRDVIKPPSKTAESWLGIIHDTLSNLHLFGDAEKICNAAVTALSEVNHITISTEAFAQVATNQESGDANKVLDDYLSKLKSDSEKQRVGYSQAISALPQHVLHGSYEKVLQTLMRATKPYGHESAAFAEAHMHAVKALVKIAKRMDVDETGDPNKTLCRETLNDIYDTLIRSLSDYTKDSRGDVGSMVRLEGIKGIQALTLTLVEKNVSILDEEIVKKVMCSVFQQCGEKIHRVRDGARDAIYALLYHKPPTPHIPHHDELSKIFYDPNNQPSMKALFEMTSKVLAFDVYLYNMLLGLVVSVGDLTLSLAAASGEALCAYLDKIYQQEKPIEKFMNALIKIFEDYNKVTRISLPLLKTLQLLLQRGYFSGIAEIMENPGKKDSPLNKVPDKIFQLIKQEIARTKDAQKILISLEVFCGFFQFPSTELRKRNMARLVCMLGHTFPKVRRSTAAQLYEAVLTYEELVPQVENLETVMVLLSETEWDGPVQAIRPIRNELCGYFDVPVPKATTKKE